jgi:hypothetical protein
MQLLMTVHQRIAGIVCHKVHLDRIQGHDVDHVLHEPAEPLIADTDNFKGMAVQVDRMLVSTSIAQDHPITLACLKKQRINVWPRLIIDSP